MSTLLASERPQLHSSADTNSSFSESSITYAPQGEAWSTAPLELPNLNLRSAYAASAKAAARLNATTATPKELEELLAERQMLLDKLFSGQSTKADENRLEYVRWSLDRIEDAKHGAVLDVLETQAEAYESFLSEVQKFYQHLDSRIQHPKR